MAGFFLYCTNDSKLNIEKALLSFSENGLKNPAKYTLGDHTLLLFRKLVEEAPASAENEYGFCAAVGAYMYKGLNSRESLLETLKDYARNKLLLSEIYGHYTLILYSNDRITIISDPLSAKHFFSDRNYSFFSSSLFAAAAAIGNYTINDQAVYEKLLTGVIVSPDTVIHEIIQMNKKQQITANQSKCGVTFITHPDIDIKPFHQSGIRESAQNQADSILNYFRQMKSVFEEDRVDLGLSAGHDSSLLFAALNHEYRDILHLHTHSTGHVHDREKSAASDMAKKKGMEITIVPTPRLDEDDIDLTRLLKENLMFFDGRTSHDIGGFSATYRSEYRMYATGGCRSSLSGVGGECLRNHYSIRGRRIDADYFFVDKIFNKSFVDNAPGSLVEKIKEMHIRKAEAVLNVPLHGRVDRLNLRRYYSEILMADGQGNVIDAYNTVSRCFAPFLEQRILAEAYRGINYLGNSGEYESMVISILDPDVGSCRNANNGYPFNHIPYKVRLKEVVRARVSTRLWENINQYAKRSRASSGEGYFSKVVSKNDMMLRAYTRIRERYPDICFDNVIAGYAMDANVAYLALTMEKLNNEL